MRVTFFAIALGLGACGSSDGSDGGGADAAGVDAGSSDAGPPDAGAGDAGTDAGGMDAGIDAGTDAGVDAGPFDAGPFDAGPPSPAIGTGTSLGALMPADIACRGVRAAPAGAGGAIAYDGTLIDFFNGDPVSGLVIHHFADDEPTATCGPGCLTDTSDASGTVALRDLAGSWSADRVLGGTGFQAGAPREYVPLLEYHVPTPAVGGSVDLSAVQRSTLNTIITLLGVSAAPGQATVMGELTDCAGDPIANARVRIFDASGEVPLGTGRSGPRAFYFNGDGFPSAAQRQTHVDGLYGATNVPPGARLRVELWGSPSGGPPELLGCEAIEGIADGLTLVDVGPRRADGPSDCTP